MKLLERFEKRETNDKVIILKNDILEIYDVVGKNETDIITDHHVFPISDATVKINPEGGLYYLFNCDLRYLQETEHLKDVEQNIAIRNMFNFGESERKFDIKFYVMLAVIVIIVFLMRH